MPAVGADGSSTIHGAATSPGHHPARDGCQLPRWVRTGFWAQSSRHSERSKDWSSKRTVCVRAQNSAQFSRLPWPWPVVDTQIFAPPTPAGTVTVRGASCIATGRAGSP